MPLAEWVGTADNLHEAEPFFNRKSAIYGFTITSLIISTICATLRLHVRFFVTRSPGWDDYFIILIVFLSLTTNVGSLFLVNFGLGQHFIYLSVDGMLQFVKACTFHPILQNYAVTDSWTACFLVPQMFWWCNASYNMSMAAIKLSLLFQYLRLLNDHTDSDRGRPTLLRAAVIVLVIITSAWGFVFSFLAWVPSVPVSADWNYWDTTATRYGYSSNHKSAFVATFIVHGACNMTIDVAILILPLLSRAMWSSAGRQRKSRIAMLCLFALGVLSVVCSVVRLASLLEHRAATWPTFDPSWYAPTVIVLSMLEVNIATTMASLPVFWPYLRRNIDRIWITHEIEVKVTEHFTQIDDDQAHEEHRPDGQAGRYTPWADGAAGSGKASGELGHNTSVVMMRDLGRGGSAGGGAEDLGLPFDGSRGHHRDPGHGRGPSRMNFVLRR